MFFRAPADLLVSARCYKGMQKLLYAWLKNREGGSSPGSPKTERVGVKWIH